MRGKTRARDLAPSRHHVDDSIRDLGLLQQLGEEQRAEWRLLGWLEDHAVAAGEGRRELPRGHEQREVPRDDLPHHADRLAQRVAEVLPRKRYLLSRSIELGHPAGVVAKCGCGQRHVKQQRIVDRHPVVERFELRKLVGPLLEHVTDLPQDLRPQRRIHRGVVRGEVSRGTSDALCWDSCCPAILVGTTRARAGQR